MGRQGDVVKEETAPENVADGAAVVVSNGGQGENAVKEQARATIDIVHKALAEASRGEEDLVVRGARLCSVLRAVERFLKIEMRRQKTTAAAAVEESSSSSTSD